MKKILLSVSFVFLMTLAVFAYETVIVKYPEEENWVKVYYKKVGNEAIAQYVPVTQSRENWTRTVVIHAYKDSAYTIRTFMGNSLARMERANRTSNYRMIRQTENDAIAVRCTDTFQNVSAQCEIFRGTTGHGGIVSIHYINKDKKDFMNNYKQWYEIIKGAKLYNSYYRDERTLDKSEYCEFY